MNIQDFLGIGIVGLASSLIVEFITRKYGTSTLTGKGVSIGTALVVGTVYFFISSTSWFPSVLGVLVTSSTIYALFFKKNNS